MRVARPFVWLSLGLALGACTEDVTAPGRCPDFCPAGSLAVVDTVLGTIIARDSSYRGFVLAHEASVLLAATLPGVVDSRPVFLVPPIQSRLRLATGSSTDTTTGPVKGVDSVQLRLIVTRRDTAAHTLTLKLYRLPLTIDSATSFDDLKGSFTDSVRTIEIDSLLARPGKKDPVTGDSVVVDTVKRQLTLILALDSAQAPYVPADSGKLAFGLRVAADSLASIALGAREAGLGPEITWFVKVDSLGAVVHRTQVRLATFDSFVFDPPAPALDQNLAVGGMPSARSILRVTLPRSIRDSTQILRATLVVVPAVAARGVPADSFTLEAHAVDADLGAKSPLAAPRFTGDTTRMGTTRVRIGSLDSVRVELTTLLRIWSVDTAAATAIILRQVPEGASFAEIRFHPSGDAAFRPALHLTYLPRFRFGVP